MTVAALPRVAAGSAPATFAPSQSRRLTPEERDRALHAELRRARIRIAQLERSLETARRDALAHLDRARAAERRLATLVESRT